MIFIETSVFSRQRQSSFDEDTFRKFQEMLLERPDAGAKIPGAGGLRKVRWAAEGRGKRGGVRVIYFHVESREIILLLLVYPKNVQDDLTPEQKQKLVRIVNEELEREGRPT